MATLAEAFFLPAETGQRFCLFHPAQGPTVHGQVLYIHPFAEEMNKARRMASLQARALAQAGFEVLQLDLLGCGDSSGDFGDASWHHWVSDVVQGCHCLRSQPGAQGRDEQPVPLWLWGLRSGCLLAGAAARQWGRACHFVFWQPPSFGQAVLQQFLRLKTAGALLGHQGGGNIDTLRQQLAAGLAIELAGYRLSPGLISGLAHAVLAPPPRHSIRARLEWFELSTHESPRANTVTTASFTQWQQAGFDARLYRVRGPAFWHSTDIEEAPALISATTAALRALAPPTLLNTARS